MNKPEITKRELVIETTRGKYQIIEQKMMQVLIIGPSGDKLLLHERFDVVCTLFSTMTLPD